MNCPECNRCMDAAPVWNGLKRPWLCSYCKTKWTPVDIRDEFPASKARNDNSVEQAQEFAERANKRQPVEEPNGNPNCAHDFRNGPTIQCPMTCRKCGMDVY